MTDYRDFHATIFVASEAAHLIEAARREWDPVMAAQIAAHVTLAYPQEAPIIDLLVERVRAASITCPPFRLRLGGSAYFERPEGGGVYVKVEDIDGGYRKMREDVLQPPFDAVAFPPHVTVVHPRTSRRGRDFWKNRGYRLGDQVFTVMEVTITAFDGIKWVVRQRFALEGKDSDTVDPRGPKGK
jgi:2'-5' RNA ligase